MSDSETLAAFLDSTPAGTRLRVEDDLGDGFVRLRVSEAERRQAKQDIRCVEDAVIEMLRNARDAHARTIIMGTSRMLVALSWLTTATAFPNGCAIEYSSRVLPRSSIQ